jgi:hypothetical protein
VLALRCVAVAVAVGKDIAASFLLMRCSSSCLRSYSLLARPYLFRRTGLASLDGEKKVICEGALTKMALSGKNRCAAAARKEGEGERERERK